MNRIAIIAGYAVVSALLAYVAFFALWALMVSACAEYGRGGCGDNRMTAMVRTAYAPLVEAATKKEPVARLR